MKSFIFLIVLTLNLPIFAACQQFMGIKVDSTLQYIKNEFKKTDFKLVEESGKGDIFFSGKIGYDEVLILVTETPKSKKVYQFFIIIEKKANSWIEIESKFNTYYDILESKYGKPTIINRDFENPFEKGDGYEFTALKSGKLNYYDSWTDKSLNQRIMLSMEKNATITILYQNIYNNEINLKEQKEMNKKIF